MQIQTAGQLALFIIEVVFGISLIGTLVVLAVRKNVSKETLSAQNELISTLKTRVDVVEAENKELKASHIESVRRIGELEGQINNLKTLPLKQIADSLKATSKTQEHIISMLNKANIGA